MTDAPLMCAISDKADLAALRGVLACALTRPPKVGRVNSGDHVSAVEMTWVRLDSPKREASLRISCLENQRVPPGSAEDMRLVAVEVLERALSDDPAHAADQTQVDRWHSDLKALSAYASIRQHAEDPRVSRVDICQVSAATAWAEACGDRPGTKGTRGIIPTMDGDRVRRLLPNLPKIVLVREGKVNNAGRSHVVIGAMHGTTTFMDLDLVERMRLDARFGPLEA